MLKNYKALYILGTFILALVLISSNTFAAAKLAVSISGPSSLDYGESGTYTATGSGGTAPYTYAWYKSEDGGSTWSGVDLGVSSVSITAYGTDFIVKCVVYDDIMSTAQTTKSVDALAAPALSVSISGPTSLSSGQTGTYYANVSGGVAPYTYSWAYRIVCSSASSSAATITAAAPPTEPCGVWNYNAGSSSTFTRTSDGRSIAFELHVTDAAGQTTADIFATSGSSSLSLPSVDDAEEMQAAVDAPKELSLSNYPNPFNPTTSIALSIPESGYVSLKVYDMLGREVAVLANKVLSPGKYTYQFDAGSLASGTYIYRLVTPSQTITKKMLLMK